MAHHGTKKNHTTQTWLRTHLGSFLIFNDSPKIVRLYSSCHTLGGWFCSEKRRVAPPVDGSRRLRAQQRLRLSRQRVGSGRVAFSEDEGSHFEKMQIMECELMPESRCKHHAYSKASFSTDSRTNFSSPEIQPSFSIIFAALWIWQVWTWLKTTGSAGSAGLMFVQCQHDQNLWVQKIRKFVRSRAAGVFKCMCFDHWSCCSLCKAEPQSVESVF